MSSAKLIRGGHVIDPAQGIDEPRDVVITDGEVGSVESAADLRGDVEVFDASGYLVVPGLIDIHAHIYYGMTNMSVDPSTDFHPNGVTVVVDAGTSGAANFLGLRTYILEPSPLHLYAFLNIYGIGMAGGPGESFRFIKGVKPLEMAEVEGAAKMIARNRDRLVGIKLMAPSAAHDYVGDTAELVARTRQVAESADTPAMIHINGGEPLATVLDPLVRGDIVTHAFQGNEPTVIGPDGRVRPEVLAARERGVLFDFAPSDNHHFSWGVLESAAEQRFWPDTISTDVANAGRGNRPFAPLPDCMSMLLHVGLPLSEVVRAATAAPAAAIGREDQHGSLAAGRAADVAILELVDRPTTFSSMRSEERTVQKRLLPVATMVGGEWMWQRDTDSAAQ